MKVFLTSAYPFDSEKNFAVSWLKESAEMDPFRIHSLAADPVEADVILFVEHHPGMDPYFFRVIRNDIYRKFQEKCFLYHDCDWVIPIVPGIYPSIEKKIYNPSIMRSGHYIARLCENDAIRYLEKPVKKYLFSFVGASKTHPCRRSIFKIMYDECYLRDSSGQNSWNLSSEGKRRFEEDYVRISGQSQFILCPRGVGPNTYRLFEAMEMGIAPVIISDEWVPMEGPDWGSFSLRVAENKIEELPEILEENKLKSEEMGLLARKEWEHWFSKEVSFHHLAEACRKIQLSKSLATKFERLRVYREFLGPFHFRNLLRYTRNQLISQDTN